MSCLLVALAGCGPASITPVTPAPSSSLIVYGGRADRDAGLVDLAVTPDGRVTALACVNRSLLALRWERDGRLAVERPIGPLCNAQLVLTHDDEVVVADSLCTASPSDDAAGCIRVRRFDATLATERWTFMPKLSVLSVLAIGPGDQLAIGGWRMQPYTQDPTKTDLHIVDGKGALVRTHELVALRTDLSAAAFTGNDLVVTGLIDPDHTGMVTIDGTTHTFQRRDTAFAARFGATRWFARFEELDVESYTPPRLALADARHAVVVGMARPRAQHIRSVGYAGSDLVEIALRLDLATGAVVAGTHRKAGELGEFISDVVATHRALAISRPTVRDVDVRRGACREGEPCRHTNGPEAYGKTTLAQVHRIVPGTLAFGPALTSYMGYGITADDRLAYATDRRALYLGGSLTGSMTIGGRVITTEQTRDAPCTEHSARAGGVQFMLALEPPEDPCLVRVTYASALFITRIDGAF